MVDLPNGTVTLLFTDVEGSTQLLRRLGERYGAALEDQRRILREAVAEHGGTEIDSRGDELFAAFPRARAGLTAAIAAQRSRSTRGPTARRSRFGWGCTQGSPACATTAISGSTSIALRGSRPRRTVGKCCCRR